MTNDYIPFQLAADAFLVPARAVREILGAQRCTKIPHENPRVSGVFPWNGRAIPLLLLDQVLRLSRPRIETVGPVKDGGGRTLVVESSGDIVGLCVDEVREVVRIPAEDFRPVHALDQLYSSAEIEWPGGVARLVDLEKMVNECFQQA